jgi:hypothetical protein
LVHQLNKEKDGCNCLTNPIVKVQWNYINIISASLLFVVPLFNLKN